MQNLVKKLIKNTLSKFVTPSLPFFANKEMIETIVPWHCRTLLPATLKVPKLIRFLFLTFHCTATEEHKS